MSLEDTTPLYVKYYRVVRYREADPLAWVETHAHRSNTSEIVIAS